MSTLSSSSPQASETTTTQTNPNTIPALSGSASLYLYTFLATLVLLLTVSALIIARSYALRRRQQRIIDEAIRNGTYVPPPSRIFGPPPLEKPILHDVYLTSNQTAREGWCGTSAEDSSERWRELPPIAASKIATHPESSDSRSPALQIPLTWAEALMEGRIQLSSIRPFLRRHRETTSTPTSAPAPSLTSADTTLPKKPADKPFIHLYYFVQLPSIGKGSEEAIPPLEVGVLRCREIDEVKEGVTDVASV
ncbi:hypothetical protein BXZ70DRAFT_690488 [Cristinia sonorae]|uniref:Uncharacterized protein n=1 Tax=Cristinia sonorae TaxID=1940300 RepID=A0A8K0UDF6_9AGAR|nr:hypothetical protein BXZ70DRAFT_690488 [Cristinia sonorae]